MELTSPREVKELCKKFDFTFSKGLGQNFLLDKNILENIADAADAEQVLEIGPGFGVLTYELCKKCKKVVSIEVDKRLMPVLEYTLSEFDNVNIVWGDVLKIDLKKLLEEEFSEGEISVAANLPYYITTPIIAGLLESGLPFKNIIVMIQKEVAQRICAQPGSKEYGAISVMCQYYSIPEIIGKVPAGSFMPPPKVDSAVLKLNVTKEPRVRVQDEKMFFKVVKSAFAQRRKTLSNCLSHGLGLDKNTAAEILIKCGLTPEIRGEKLGLEEFARISDEIVNLK